MALPGSGLRGPGSTLRLASWRMVVYGGKGFNLNARRFRMLSEVGLNPTGLLPGAISIAESVGMKEYEQFSFIYRAWPEC